ncbi:hypothetical protein [Alteribacter keqinensis]|uniref:Uncharacterized protein n=1 Tax=Alteribacter keqinensis TaxID=2483800 RepID=A0A3M7TX71_9BACI|nr:hypothetical protein [Alteribacter keqinensis]RNA69871.1 hypothetical protein EBO34_08040 [Alteribacter keqinensis]
MSKQVKKIVIEIELSSGDEVVLSQRSGETEVNVEGEGISASIFHDLNESDDLSSDEIASRLNDKLHVKEVESVEVTFSYDDDSELVYEYEKDDESGLLQLDEEDDDDDSDEDNEDDDE